ncbi:MAG TPA: hypothetical protein VI894_00545 [Candidatus Nanoarchaeia archaeon]|nr:hypothetical protein [Candidatus Nanoarchaeia archaeon]
MRALVFDAGPIISLTINNLLWTLEPLKQKFGGEFYITENVRAELIDKPIETRKFKFEALQVMRNIRAETIKIMPSDKIQAKTEELLNIANSIFVCRKNPVKIVHYGEMSSLVAAKMLETNYVVIDERTTRLLIEDADSLVKHMRKKFHSPIQYNKDKINAFQEETKNIKVIRSAELAIIAYRLGILNSYLPEKDGFKQPEKTLLESVLWGVKLNGCSLTEDEINQIVEMEGNG